MSENTIITFELIEVNQIRSMRGKGHAKFSIFENGEQVDWRWFNNKDIKSLAKEFPDQKSVLETGLV